MKTFSPYVVVAVSLSSTLIAVGVGLQVPVGVAVGVVVGEPVPEETGNVAVAVLHGPVAEVALQLPGSFAEDAPHEAGIAALRAFKAVKKAAYDLGRELLAKSHIQKSRPSSGTMSSQPQIAASHQIERTAPLMSHSEVRISPQQPCSHLRSSSRR